VRSQFARGKCRINQRFGSRSASGAPADPNFPRYGAVEAATVSKYPEAKGRCLFTSGHLQAPVNRFKHL
jgi:hypothetical protein